MKCWQACTPPRRRRTPWRGGAQRCRRCRRAVGRRAEPNGQPREPRDQVLRPGSDWSSGCGRRPEGSGGSDGTKQSRRGHRGHGSTQILVAIGAGSAGRFAARVPRRSWCQIAPIDRRRSRLGDWNDLFTGRLHRILRINRRRSGPLAAGWRRWRVNSRSQLRGVLNATHRRRRERRHHRPRYPHARRCGRSDRSRHRFWLGGNRGTRLRHWQRGGRRAACRLRLSGCLAGQRRAPGDPYAHCPGQTPGPDRSGRPHRAVRSDRTGKRTCRRRGRQIGGCYLPQGSYCPGRPGRPGGSSRSARTPSGDWPPEDPRRRGIPHPAARHQCPTARDDESQWREGVRRRRTECACGSGRPAHCEPGRQERRLVVRGVKRSGSRRAVRAVNTLERREVPGTIRPGSAGTSWRLGGPFRRPPDPCPRAGSRSPARFRYTS
jgi:hypothetical protein